MLECLTVEVAKANPVRLGWVPTAPDTDLPQITVESPSQNKTYISNEISLNFTVNFPESWFNNAPRALNPPDGHYCNGKILSAQIRVDDDLIHSISVNNDSYLPYSSTLPLSKSQALTANLSVPEGGHVLVIHVLAESYYSPSGNLTFVCYPISAYSVPVSFYVGTSFSNSSLTPSPIPSPTLQTIETPTLTAIPSQTTTPSSSPTQQPAIEPSATIDP